MADQITNYKCPACTGPLHFVGASGKLECDYCGSSYSVEEIEAIVRGETELDAALSARIAAIQKEKAALDRALYLSLRSVSSILFLIYFSIAAPTAFFQPSIRSLRLLSLIDGINSLNLSETPTSSSILPQSPQPSPARYAAPVAVDSTL